MQDQTLWILIGAVVVLGLVFWLVARRRKSAALREHFGDEYDRTVEARGGVGKAEHDLEEREARVKKLDIRPLGSKERGEFIDEWREVKAVFVDSPVEAAGFEFVGESQILRYPNDDHTLPVCDPKVRRQTDQFILRFRKPVG